MYILFSIVISTKNVFNLKHFFEDFTFNEDIRIKHIYCIFFFSSKLFI